MEERWLLYVLRNHYYKSLSTKLRWASWLFTKMSKRRFSTIVSLFVSRSKKLTDGYGPHVRDRLLKFTGSELLAKVWNLFCRVRIIAMRLQHVTENKLSDADMCACV